MSGEPTDAQLLTCSAVEAHAVANWINAGYGNVKFLNLFVFQR